MTNRFKVYAKPETEVEYVVASHNLQLLSPRNKHTNKEKRTYHSNFYSCHQTPG